MATIQQRLKERRLAMNLTLLEVAEILGVKEATVQRYESGEIKNIKHETVVKLAEILQCTPAYLMGWEQPDLSAFDELTFSVASGNVNLDDEIKALIGRINTASTVKYGGKEANAVMKALTENTLEHLLKNLDMVSEK